MAKTNSAKKVSSGDRKLQRKARHEKRLARFAQRKADGKCYKYSKEHAVEKRMLVSAKEYTDNKQYYDQMIYAPNQNSSKPVLANDMSVMRKLDNQIAKEKAEAKNRKDKKDA